MMIIPHHIAKKSVAFYVAGTMKVARVIQIMFRQNLTLNCMKNLDYSFETFAVINFGSASHYLALS